ncbi:DUF4242 domain-containing protein [Mycobacteroides abscessus]|uniref:DUF4242 domain-containing protein n=1 Tax=Mycobacteroides abscessus TaxID=36809 RepID=A0ABD7HLI2_9MYCO|nr:DUF4242 domain-containing protein [Mycobacteroides abscessus]AWG67105.1 DUF4242 domain-containing protein [Mycobacteroides abscessus]PVA79191.1 DUF4242 domain-containing protein [Mycobacteroides abscessus]PVB20759.1 DUF4242 domain-containing protein [Mycobacteroides abscessus]PVB25441.1 DUF4242 domain-containing protein [Mycobacteroides abscessus]RIR18150.1 DUF4242 domain-containing protein [Mycobacteroides abscessus]
MTLHLYEISVAPVDTPDVTQLLKEIDARVHRYGGELIEAQVTSEARRIFVIAEFDGEIAPWDSDPVGAEQVSGPHAVRLVGADLDQLKSARPAAGYLVEWDLPADLDMETYLARKKAKAPKYADVPEVSFLRTYVREDMDKCLCFYDAPDEEAVLRARKAVDTPVDRLHGLGEISL